MISREYWQFNLTTEGWVEGSHKTDTQGKVEVPKPAETLLVRHFYSDLDLGKGVEDGYHDFDKQDGADDLLAKYPAPEGYEDFKPSELGKS